MLTSRGEETRRLLCVLPGIDNDNGDRTRDLRGDRTHVAAIDVVIEDKANHNFINLRGAG